MAEETTNTNTTRNDLPNNDVRARLREHFDVPLTSQASQWSSLWDAGDFLPWDKGFPSPSLEELLSASTPHGSLARGDHVVGRKKKALVPGCGRGYDVGLLAGYGYLALGVEVSAKAVEQARRYWEGETEKKKGAGAVASTVPGEVRFVEGDFFKDTWRGEEVGGEGKKEVFDLIYDYTFLCALPPTLRPSWAKRMAELLDREAGHLICLEFPLNKEPETGGPPWGLTSEVYDEILGEAGLEKVVRYRPERFHEIGQGRDMVSVWRHRR